MLPLASDLLPFPGQMRREGHLKSASLPDRLSSSGRIMILGTTLRSCREVKAVPVDKIAWGCKQATESAGVSWALGCRGVVSPIRNSLEPHVFDSFRTREEFVTHCSESCRCARVAGGTKGSDQTYAVVELLRVTG